LLRPSFVPKGLSTPGEETTERWCRESERKLKVLLRADSKDPRPLRDSMD